MEPGLPERLLRRWMTQFRTHAAGHSVVPARRLIRLHTRNCIVEVAREAQKTAVNASRPGPDQIHCSGRESQTPLTSVALPSTYPGSLAVKVSLSSRVFILDLAYNFEW